MNKLGNAMTFSGLLLAILSLFSLSAGYLEPRFAVLGNAADEALTISAILVLIAVLLRFSPSLSIRVMPRELRILLWIGAVSVVGLTSCRVAESLDLTAPSEQTIVQEFQKLYHKNITFDSHFLGVQSIQFPADNWVMQEIITETRPEVIVETGTAKGGTTLFYATILEQLKGGRIITVDIDDHDPKVTEFAPWKERVQFIKGSSVAPEVFDQIKQQVDGRKVMVTLDSEHTKEHVLKELELYSTLVPVGGYLVVQDTHLNGHPVPWPRLEKTGGPMEAVQEFLKTNKNFEVDRSREKHLVTQNPSGFLKRIS